ncbi:MAG TPA: hypothetical protein VJ770_00670 [Stellaceae bacterium]|nr:hypothetical protein [Stellaceae bacterium]
MPEYWRIRVIVGNTEDRTRDAWNRDEVGVWYGASTAQDCIDALVQNNVTPANYLWNLPANRALNWDITDGFFRPLVRFTQIPVGDWAVVFFRETQQIGIAQICSIIQSDENHLLNLNGEIFKFRKLCNKRIFRLSHLPGAYHLLPGWGFGNVNRINGLQKHVSLLIQSQTEADVSRALRAMPHNDLLDFLGAAEWESFCTAYLIIEEGFVPTGLSTGRALPVVDIVGRRRGDGSRIYAQCKKDPNSQEVSNEFRALCSTLAARDTAYFFAYGGCHGNRENITVFDRDCAQRWVATENGRRYIELFTAA